MLARVVDLRALAADREARVAEVVEDVPGPGHGPAGDDDVRGARRGGRGERVTGARRRPCRRRAAACRRDRSRSSRYGERPAGASLGDRLQDAPRPPRYGRSTSGTRTEPSACWWFSRIATIVRGTAHSVPLSVASGRTFLPSRIRIDSRRDWNSVQFEVEVSSRYLPWVGIHASQSNLREAEEPRSPEATSITWKGSSSAGQPLLLPVQQPLVLGLGVLRARRTRTSRPCRTGARGRCPGCPCRTSRPRGGSRARSPRSAAAAGRRR